MAQVPPPPWLDEARINSAPGSGLDAINAWRWNEDLVKVVLTNVRTARQVTVWLHVPPAKDGDELDQRIQAIQCLDASLLPDAAKIMLEDWVIPGQPGPAYTPEDYLAATLCNRIRTPNADATRAAKEEYDHAKHEMARGLLVDHLPPDELAARQKSLCDAHVRARFGHKTAQNGRQWDATREAFNRAINRYLLKIKPKKPRQT